PATQPNQGGVGSSERWRRAPQPCQAMPDPGEVSISPEPLDRSKLVVGLSRGSVHEGSRCHGEGGSAITVEVNRASSGHCVVVLRYYRNDTNACGFLAGGQPRSRPRQSAVGCTHDEALEAAGLRETDWLARRLAARIAKPQDWVKLDVVR